MDPLTILHLYPRELGINGDVGNVTALTVRANARGIPTKVIAHHSGQIESERADIVHIGSGPLSGQQAVHTDLLRNSDFLRSLVVSGVPFLAISGGWQLLGQEIITANGDKLEGAGVFPTSATLSHSRTVGEIAVRSDFGVLAGFENHSATTSLHNDAPPLGVVLGGGGDNSHSSLAGLRIEGVAIGVSIGTNLHGPFLPMNPQIADHLLSCALKARGEGSVPEFSALRPVDDYAAQARKAIFRRLNIRIVDSLETT